MVHNKPHSKISKSKISKSLKDGYFNGRIVWNKGLTKETDSRVEEISKSVKEAMVGNLTGFKKGYIPWNKGKKMSLSTVQKRINTMAINKIKRICVHSGEEIKLFLCKCGCGEIVEDTKFRKHAYIKGHNSYKTKLYWSEKNKVNIPYQSTYELASFCLLEKMEIVKSYSRCPYLIDYEYEGRTRRYIPDILITYDDRRQEVVEIKPQFRLTESKNISKFEAAKKYFENKGIKFLVWSEKEIF